ncbi:uncharacterized protein LOC128988035 [Macrosteles quadrilineatus]|uniref:uncharacterized protein LOC128988035 n=1 Tax=Macrosteles quadrilineatus TaxID=74068 RepID=UPI0023E3089D|nr:uncharacterized protein LOC128988035 [Macrosteles quadrilineatus]
MIKLCILLALGCAGALAVTQEQLAQYVAAQQTAGAPRARQAYALHQAEEAGDDAYQTAGNAAYIKAGDAAYQTAGNAAYLKAGDAAYHTAGNAAFAKSGSAAYIKAGNAAYIKAGDEAYHTAGNAAYAKAGNPAYIKAGNDAYQQAYNTAYQQAASAYQPAQPAPQASSYKSFSSSVGSQPQPVYYRPAPQYSAQPAPAPLQYRKVRPLAADPEKEPEDYDPNPAYQFSFDVKDDEFTNYQNRKEQREGDKISGSYSVVDSDGYIRTVTYTADPKEGFKAEVSREPTEIRVKLPQPPAALPQQYQQIPQQLLRKQQTQQYLEASSPAVASPQYRPQSVAYVAPQYAAAPQYGAAPQYAQAAPQYVAKAAPAASGLAAYSGQHRLAAPAKPKASAIGYAQQPTGSSPILYQAYQP